MLPLHINTGRKYALGNGSDTNHVKLPVYRQREKTGEWLGELRADAAFWFLIR